MRRCAASFAGTRESVTSRFCTGWPRRRALRRPTRAELARFDRTRPKKGSNDDWMHPQDPDAKITKMKDGRTHVAHKAEHAVDLETGAVVGVTVQDADAGDTTTMVETLITAAEQIEAVLPDGAGLAEVVGDTGYHSNATLVALADVDIRSYVSEPARGRRHWHGKPEARDAVYGNRRRIQGARGKRLLRQRAERRERPNAHLYETGRLRRVYLRGHANILKRLLVHVCGSNLGLLMRYLTGVGTPRSLQGRVRALLDTLITVLSRFWHLVTRSRAFTPSDRSDPSWIDPNDTASSTCSVRATRKGFCHGLLGQEAGGPVGHLIPVPQDAADSEDDDPYGPLKRQIATLRGRVGLIETTAAGYGEGARGGTAGRLEAPPHRCQSARERAGATAAGRANHPERMRHTARSGAGRGRRESRELPPMVRGIRAAAGAACGVGARHEAGRGRAP